MYTIINIPYIPWMKMALDRAKETVYNMSNRITDTYSIRGSL